MRTISTSVLFLSAVLSAQAATIDDFSIFNPPDNAASVSGGTGTDSATDTGLNPANTIGGQRDLDIDVTTNTIGLTGSLSVQGGFLILEQSPGVASTAEVTWGGGGALAVDLTSDGADAFALDIASIDLSIDVIFEVTDGNAVTGSLLRTGLVAGVESFEFTDFANSPDFTDIDSITLRLVAPSAADATFELLETTSSLPEPASVGLFSLGLLCIALAARRRRS